MQFDGYTIPGHNRLSEIQNGINKGTNLCNRYLDLGGHSAEDYLIAKRAHEEEKENISLLRPISKANLLYHFLGLHKKLRWPAAWLELRKSLPFEKQEKLDGLKAAWERQADYSHFTTDALFEVAAVLKELRSLVFKNAQQEIGKKKYRAKNYIADYKNYLNDLLAQIKQAQENLAEALFYRIKAAYGANTLQQYNPIFSLLRQFQELAIPTPYTNLLTNQFVCAPLSEFPLARAYAYILSHGTPVLRTYTSSFFALEVDSKSIPLEPIKHNSSFFFVPKLFTHYIPTAPWFLVNLFPGYKMRYQFFHDKTEFLFKLSVLSNSKMPLEIVNMQSHYWKNLENLQDSLVFEKADALSKRNIGWGWLRKTSSAFISDWEEFIQTQQYQILLRQMNYLAMISEAPLSLDYAFDESEETFAIKQSMGTALEKVEAIMPCLSLSDKEKHHFNAIKYKIIRRWGIQEGSGPIESVLVNLGNAITMPDVKFNDCFIKLKLKNSNELTQLANKNFDYLNFIIKNIDNFIGELHAKLDKNLVSHDEPQFIKQSASILSLFNKISLVNNSELTHNIEEKLIKFIAGYQKYLKKASPELIKEKNDELIGLETIIHHVLFINLGWNNLRNKLFKAEQYREAHLKGKKPIDKDEYLRQLREEHQQKIIDDAQLVVEIRQEGEVRKILTNQMKLDFEKRRQERNQLTEKLATLGIYQEKNDKSSKEIMQRKLPLFLS